MKVILTGLFLSMIFFDSSVVFKLLLVAGHSLMSQSARGNL